MDARTGDLLDADELLAEPLRPARRTKRLLNLLIDTAFFYVIVLSIGLVVVIISPDTLVSLENTNPLLDRLVGTLLFAGYCLGFEAWLGKTPGKLITKTKVVDRDGRQPVFSTIVWRNLARIIPFDALTFLQERPIGLHDRLGHTMVVDDRPRPSFDRSLAGADE